MKMLIHKSKNIPFAPEAEGDKGNILFEDCAFVGTCDVAGITA